MMPLMIPVCYCRATFLPNLKDLSAEHFYSAIPSITEPEFTMMQDISDAVREDEHGSIITIEVTPGSKHTLFPAAYNPWRKAIGCHVTAPPMEGKANRAVVGLIADCIAVPRTRVEILSGTGGSIKRVRIRGISREAVCSALREPLR